MTWLWVLLWIILSAIILGAFLWSTIILQKQKRAWAAYAKKYNLKYIGGKFLESPSMSGNIRNFYVSCFSALRDPDDPKARRYVSALEIKFPNGLVGTGAAGTKEMHNFMQTLNLLFPYDISSEHWNKDHRFITKDADITKVFLDEKRLRHLNAILSLKNSDVLLMYDEKDAVVRIETSDPIVDVAAIEKVVDFVIKHAEGLMVTSEQRMEIYSIVKGTDT